MEFTTENIAFIGMLFVIAVLVWALVKNGFTIANLIPAPLVQDIIKTAVNTALDAAQKQAETTETKADDELVKLIREEISKMFPAVIIPPDSDASA